MARSSVAHYERVESAVVGEAVPVRVSLKGLAESDGATVNSIGVVSSGGVPLAISGESFDSVGQRWTGYVSASQAGAGQLRLEGQCDTELIIKRYVNIHIVQAPAADAK